MTALLVSVQVDGTEVVTDFPATITGTGIEFLDFGVATPPIDDAHRSFRNIKVGTTGWGSSDLFAPALTSSGDFNSGVFGATGAVSFSAGVMEIAEPPSGLVVGEQDLAAPVSDIYVQFDYRRNRAAGDGDGDYVFVYDEGFNNVDGFGLGGGSGNDIVSELGWGPLVGAGPADGVWQTVALHYVIGGTPPPVPLSVDTDAFTVSTSGPLTVNVSTDAAGWDPSDTSIALTLTGLPFGITASFSDASVVPGAGSVLTINVNGGAAAGVYTLTLTGTGSTGDVFSVTITVAVDVPAGAGTDTVSATVQAGANLESADYNSIDWTQTAVSGNFGVTQSQDVPGPSMVAHDGTFYVAHMEPDETLTPFVHYYDAGTDAWVAVDPHAAILAHYGSLSGTNFVADVKLASDGTTLFMSFRYWIQVFPGPPPTYAAFMSIWEWDGAAWSFAAEQFLDQGLTLGLGEQSMAAFGGTAYLSGTFGDTQLVMDSDGNIYAGAPTYSNSLGDPVPPPSPQVVAAGGTPLLLTLYPEDATDPASLDDHDAGWSFRVYTLDGTLVAKKLEADAIGPVANRHVPGGSPGDSNMRFGVSAGDVVFVTDRYYVDTGGPVVTVSADGTAIGYPFNLVDYCWARELSFGFLAWDSDDAKLWILDDAFSPLIVRVLQPPCAADRWPTALKWTTLLDGSQLDQPFYIPDGANLNSEMVWGDSHIDGDLIWSAVMRAQLNPASENPGDTSDPTYIGHIQVWKTTICRECGGCPGVLEGGFNVWQDF
jgi:hypothetical protein